MSPSSTMCRVTRHSPRVLCASLALALFGLAAPAGAQVVISQVYGGGGNANASYSHDFVELRNLGTTAVNLGGWSLKYAAAGGTGAWSNAITLSGSIAPNSFFLVQLASQNPAVGAPLPVAADFSGGINMGGAGGKIVLLSDNAALSGVCPVSASVVDFVGFGAANCSEGDNPTPALSSTTAALRVNNGCTDTNNNGADFTAAAPNPRNSTSTVAACGTGGGGEDPPPDDVLARHIYEIQGSGNTSPLLGQKVATTGVVTLRTNNGFFIQALTGDGNPATSDGLLVFIGSTSYPAVAVGNLVKVTGTVAEFSTGAANTTMSAARTVTQIGTVTGVELLGTGQTITPTVVALPETVDGDLERYEGMLVTLTGPFTIGQNFFQGRYGQLTLAYGGRIQTPTQVHRPGPLAQALSDANNRRRIILDDGTSLQNPNPTPYLGGGNLPRAGDVVTGSITGVLDYGLATNNNPGPGDDKIHPTVPPSFAVANPRTAAPAAVGGNVKAAAFNVLNYFTTFTNGNTASGMTGQGCTLGASTAAGNCRGANNLAEFQRQQAKIVLALAAIDADVIGLMEIQNNGNVAAQNLVDALNAHVGSSAYATTALPAAGTGTDAIRVAMIYKPARLAPAGLPLSDTDPVNNRPTLAQTFAAPNGEKFSVLVNHLKSKGSCPAAGDADAAGNTDAGDGQGCYNALRVQQAERLRTFVAQVQAASGSNDVLLVGDFNAYAQEDPIFALTGSGYVDQVQRFDANGYTYVFDGAAGRLDHAIATASLSARVSGAAVWHINADELSLSDYNLEFKAPNTNCGGLCPPDPYTVSPYRSSDHDPVIVGINLYKTITAAPTSTVVTGTAGDDIIQSGAGRRTLTGGGGKDQFVFTSGFAGGATITDFQPGADTISLRVLLQSLGITSANPIATQHLRCAVSGANAVISVDPDGSGPAAARAMVMLQGQNCSVLSPANFVF
ncbi:ExeM/NucH family extracellular endonuclease [Pseudorhodoferax sp.]|uniref:ExeM/NucH family extracellular endonuclease n=1 Tax=Pseudorhodoferax sp. TaxID=1993553 RepID=UPI002DD6ADD9|nr:ExeM/NucH family extracellular endonuclease [Pseudorhodoferax sp.]